MEITETTGARFELLVERLRAGDALTRGNLTLRRVGAELQCDIATLMEPESATETRARDQLARGRAEFEALVREAPALAAVAGNLLVRYILVNDYGMGTVAIAETSADSFRWLTDGGPSRPAA